MYTKLVPETGHYISFPPKFIWNHLYLFIIFIGITIAVIYKSIFYNFNITLNYWFISKTTNIKGNFSGNAPWEGPGYSCSVT